MIRKLIGKIIRLFPQKQISLEFSREKWDEEYELKKWNYLENLPELSRYSIIIGYVQYFNQNASILEVGCGTGILYKYLQNLNFMKYKGVDISEKAIEIARKDYPINNLFTACDAKDFIDNSQYDIIIFNESLYYFDDCLKILDHYIKYLSGERLFIISMVVDEKSDSHWRNINKVYNVIDSVEIKNKSGIIWNCKVIKPLAV